MPTLPQINTAQSIFSTGSLGSQEIQSSAADFGGVTAQAVGGLAQAGQSAGAGVSDAAMFKINLQRETNANNQYANSFSPALRDIYTKYYALQGKDAVDQRGAFQDQINDLRNQQRAQLKDPVAQQMFDQVSTRRVQMELDGMSRYADAQNKVYQTQASDGMVKSFQQQAADRWNDPNAFNAALQSIVIERDAHGGSIGQPVEYTNAQIQKDVSSSWIDRLRGIAAAGDAQTALGLLNNGENWVDGTGRARHTDVRSQIEPNNLAAIQSELSSHAADQIGVQYGTQATSPTPASDSLGVRNNPGNLKDPKTGQFQQFATPQQGIQAADDNLAAYGSKHGIDTIQGVINRWAPKGDGNNDPAAYAATVAKAVGIAPDAKVDLSDPAQRTKILNAMFDVESPGWRATSKQPGPTGAAAGAVSGTLPVGDTSGVPNAAQIAPQPVGLAQDPEVMRANQDAAAEQARKDAEAHVLKLTGDPAAAKRAGSVAASTVIGNTNSAIAAQQARERIASGALSLAIAGDPTKGAAPITTFAQLTANPVAYANFRQLSPAGQAAVTERLSNPGKVVMTQDAFNTYYGLRGQAVNDPDKFLKQDISTLYGKLPEAQLNELINLQASLGKRDATQDNRSLDWSRTKGEVDDMLKPMGLGAGAKAGSDESKTTEQFYGKLQESLEQYHDQNKKYPDATTTRKLAAALLVQGTQGPPSSLPSWLGGNSSIPAFQSPDITKFQPPKNEQGWTLHIDRNGNQAYVSPDGKQFQAVK